MKKIGIWGFGIVGQSAYNFFKKQPVTLQVLDNKEQNIPEWIKQTDESTTTFLKENDQILCSPGIKLHDYKQYQNKCITEADLLHQKFKGITIAITGTLGKTSVTNLLQQYTPHALAAGNIGYPMLNILELKKQPKKVILELSSFQLHHMKQFAPDIAIWTNFYPNHLDHHKSEKEYFAAKCNIFAYQTKDQIALLPCKLLNKVQKVRPINAQIYLLCTEKCTKHNYPTFIMANKSIILKTKNQDISIIADTTTLPPHTFSQNWLTIAATLYLQKIPLPQFQTTPVQLERQEHRLEYIGSYKKSKIYNDSKSTVWQATKEAINELNGESCSLFLGGLSKGTDRGPLIKYLQDKPVTVFAFGQEADQIKQLCNQLHIPCFSNKDLESALTACLDHQLPENILFSPAGASFDLFLNYMERGKQFKKLCKEILNK